MTCGVQSCNRVGDAGAFGLGKGLKKNSRLQQLWLVSIQFLFLLISRFHVAIELFDVHLFWLTRGSQLGNEVSVAGVCHIVSCILHNHNLTQAHFDHSPSSCCHHHAWHSEGLDVLPIQAQHHDWPHVLSVLRNVSFSAAVESPPPASCAPTA